MLDILSSIFADVGIDTVPWYVLDIFQELFGRVGGAILWQQLLEETSILLFMTLVSGHVLFISYLSESSLPMGVANVCDKGSRWSLLYIPTVTDTCDWDQNLIQ